MEIMNISKKRFESLQQYELPNSVLNTEAMMYILPIKNRWETTNKLLKRLYLNNGDTFGNKLMTINSLIDSRSGIDIEEIVFPEKLTAVNNEIVGYTMELIESTNLAISLRSTEVSAETKIKYLRQIGEILEKMSKVRKYTDIKDFYLNDIHENNFVIDSKTDSIKVVDIDSCKINGNYTFGSRYLSQYSIINRISKYKHEKVGNCGGHFVPSEDTELYCYIIMILNTLYNGQVNALSMAEFYNYLDYLISIGINKEIIDIFEKTLSNSPNENPYELLDYLIPYFGRGNQNVYKHIRAKTFSYR